MVMDNLYNQDTLLFDHVCRREGESDAIKEYHPEVLASHEQFQNDISHSMKAKVELVWGKKVFDRLLVLYKANFVPFPLWGEYEGIFAWLLREKYFKNADPRFRFRRVILHPRHPGSIFYGKIDTPEAIRQDKIMKAAALMAAPHQLRLIPNYYAQKKYQPRTLPGLKHKTPSKALSHQPSDSSTKDDSLLEREAWDSFFTEYPHSNDKLRELIPPAIGAIQSCASSVKWEQFCDLPLAAQEWLQGQKQILFPDTVLSSFDDIIKALDGPKWPQVLAAKTLKDKFLSIMQIQLDTLKGVEEQHQHLWHSRFAKETIEVKCAHCKARLNSDPSPGWAVYYPGVYLARQRRCKQCGGKKRTAVPVNDKVQSMNKGSASLRRPPQVAPSTFNIADYTQTDRKGEEFPATVECHCGTCYENTRLADGSNVLIDVEPKWTISTPSAYLAPLHHCLTCHKSKKVQGNYSVSQFIPIDKSIRFLFRDTIKTFHEQYRDMEDHDHKMLLLSSLTVDSKWWIHKYT